MDWISACIAKDKRKQCAKCEGMKSLSCYPENVRTMCEKRRNIDHKRHLCTECVEFKEEQKVNWISACVAEKKRSNAFHAGNGRA